MSSETRARTDTDGGAVHRTADEPAPEGTTAVDEVSEAAESTDSDGLGRQGWVLVGVVVLCFLVVPGIIYVRPAMPADAGLSFIVAMLVLPMLPALLLGLTAVWSMTAGVSEDEDSRR